MKRLSGKKVMVVEDDDMVLKAVTRYLQMEGAMVIPFHTLGAALSMGLLRGKCDIVLTDYNLGEQTPELLFNRGVPVIVCSGGYNLPKLPVKLLQKPVDPDKLVQELLATIGTEPLEVAI